MVVVGQVHSDLLVWDLELEFELQGPEPDSGLQDPELGFELWDPEPDSRDLALHLHSDLTHLG